MLTYQIRPRTFRIIGKVDATFPNEVVVNIYLQPLQAFGEANEGGRTLIQGASGTGIFFNVNNGQYSSNTAGALKPLNTRTADESASLHGRVLTLRERCDDVDSLRSLIESTCFVLPSLLALDFADPPFVERVDGTIGGVEFRWELTALALPLTVTTKSHLEEAFLCAYDDLAVVAVTHRRRLVAALNYYYTACRLLRESKTAGEFLSEAILNFSKILEIIYGTKPLDNVKEGLKVLGYTREEIDRDFFPIIDLRNSMDVGHPGTSLLTQEQLEAAHWFAERSGRIIGSFLKRLLKAVREGVYDVKRREAGAPDATTARVLQKLIQIRRDSERQTAGASRP